MGAWGTAISSNDTYADIYGEFFDLYNDGLDVTEISKKLIADNQETINDKDDCNNFWFALAKAQWECKQLDEIAARSGKYQYLLLWLHCTLGKAFLRSKISCGLYGKRMLIIGLFLCIVNPN